MEIKQELNQVKELVEQCLEEDIRCRNSDMWLLLSYWQKKQYIKIFIPYDKIMEMTPAESITRARRLIQNKLGRWLPTCPDISVKRRIREDQIKQYFSDNQWYMSEWNRIRYGVK